MKYRKPAKKEFTREALFTPERQGESARFAKYTERFFDDLGGFFKNTLIGKYYESKNNFSFNQKQKILSYLYFKNSVDLDKSRMFTYINVKDEGTKESIQNRIDHLKEMKQYNRSYFIYNMAQCQNRLRTTGTFLLAYLNS